MHLNENIMAFIEIKSELKKWDVNRINRDLENLLTSNGFDWDLWVRDAIVKCDGRADEKWIDMNLTSHPELCPNLYERLWRYSGRRFAESNEVDDCDLYVLHPELENTYTSVMIKYFQNVFGPIRVRLHNKVHKDGLYWHTDKHALIRYHLALWTNPGAFIVWTDKKLQWEPTFDPKQSKEDFNINAKFIPMNGQVYSLETGKLVHGVCNIGVGWQQDSAEQSRCHLTFWPVNPRI